MVTKLSKKQAEIVYLMKNGWELGMGMGRVPYGILQQGKLGYGGKSIDISINRIMQLWKKGVIYIAEEKFPTRIFRLKSQYK